MRHVADTIPGARLVEMSDLGHGAPNSHADRFRIELIDPLLAAVGAPWG